MVKDILSVQEMLKKVTDLVIEAETTKPGERGEMMKHFDEVLTEIGNTYKYVWQLEREVLKK